MGIVLFPSIPLPVDAGSGATFTNLGPSTVYYGSHQSVSSTSSDGSIVSGGTSPTLTGTVYLVLAPTATRANVNINNTITGSEIAVQQAGVDVALRSKINFLGSVSAADDPANDRVSVTVSGGGGGGGTSPALNVLDYGAVGDAKTVSVTTTAGSNQISFGSPALVSADIGKTILINRAGPALGTPTGVSAAAVASGGKFTAGTYYYKVSAFVAYETAVSTEVSATVVLNGAVDISWTPVAGAIGYRIYRSTTAGTYGASSLVTTVGAVATYRDLGKALFGGGPVADRSAAPLVTTITAVNTGASTATLAANATTAISGDYALMGTDNTLAFNTALAAANDGGYGNELVVPTPPYFNVPPHGSFGDPGGYLVTGMLEMNNFSYITLRGLGRPHIYYTGTSGPCVSLGSAAHCAVESLSFQPVNSWFTGDMVLIDRPDYAVFANLAANIDSVQTTITLTQPAPTYWLQKNGEWALFVQWNYNPVTHTVAAGWEGMFVTSISADGLTLTVVRGRMGSSASSHLAGSPIAKQWGQWDPQNIRVRDCEFAARDEQWSLGSMVRINGAIYCSVDDCSFGGQGGNRFLGTSPKRTGYIVLGNNEPNYRYGQQSVYANVIKLRRNSFSHGADSQILIAAGQNQGCTISENTFEPLSGGYAGAVLGLFTQSYNLIIRENWAGDADASGGTWFDGLFAQKMCVIRDNSLFTPSGGDSNSGSHARLTGQWLVEGNFMDFVDTSTGYFVDPSGASGGGLELFLGPNQYGDNAPPIIARPNFSDGLQPYDPLQLHVWGHNPPGSPTPPIQHYGNQLVAFRPIETFSTNTQTIGTSFGRTHVGTASSATSFQLNSGTDVIGAIIEIVQKGTGQITISPGSGVTILSFGNKFKTAGQYAKVQAVRVSSTEWAISGDLSV